jgi:hypothetical protein
MKNATVASIVRAVRFPTTLWAWLQKAAIQNGRTVRGEIVYRLEKSKDTVK